MQVYEKLGVFYLGRRYDPESKKRLDDLLLYDSRDLVTHAVCVGMTGSGKTGLCIGIIEEAAIDGIPAIVIDPKGDLANLLLTFPELRPADFRPFINEDEARAKGVSPDEYAAQQADLWRKGLADWDEPPERIARLKADADFTIYTPASQAGVPVSIVRSFAAPPEAVTSDREAVRERVAGTASSVLTLAGIDADPVQSREHILLSTILDHAWRSGQDLTLEALIQQVQSPPVTKLGVMDLDAFYPPKERFDLAMKINAVLAAPGFEAWMEGEPLDIARMLHTDAGKPRVAIFSIAHLNDSERMFFVSLLLNQTVAWMRTQAGTTSLRAILYMDEIAGYLPPVANPPSKQPFLTILKQGRAFGLGAVLATQNPVDLDYKGLANAGTWFVGRLQTERDKARLLDGLEGASTAAFDRGKIDALLSGLDTRVFLLQDVHLNAPELFQTRWTLSYLRGPLTREQIRLINPVPGSTAPQASKPVPAAPARATTRPVLPPDVPQQFVPVRAPRAGEKQLVYVPYLYGSAQVRFADRKTGVDQSREPAFLVPLSGGPVAVDWSKAESVELAPGDLEAEGQSGASFADVPGPAVKAQSYAGWSRDFKDWLYQSQTLDLLRSTATGVVSAPGESERDFRIRLGQATREERDRAKQSLEAKYAPKLQNLHDKLMRAQQAQERERAQAAQQKLGTALSVGATLVGAFFGRKAISATTISRASGALRSAGRIAKENQDVQSAAETVASVQQQLDELNGQFQDELNAQSAKLDPASEQLDKVSVRPKKTDIKVTLLSLAWVPWWEEPGSNQRSAAAW